MNLDVDTRSCERGVALLAVTFALLLLSVIGLGMMYSTNMETSINANYRDSLAVSYAAMAGLQEARDRIQPVTHSITAPTAPPSLTAANIIYIINPRAGETIAPWDMANAYADTELCHENVLSLSGTAGVSCTTIASGTSWFATINNSQSSSAPWNLTAPMDMKWTRITLKTNNMSSVAVNGNSANGQQVCWDGANQLTIPSGYGTNCAPNGSVASITVVSGGVGHPPAPSVTIAAPPAGGTQATATANITHVPNGQVSSVSLTAAGAGYTSAPAVSFVGDGSGAAATAVITPFGAPVTSVSLSSAGTQCYAVAPTVAVSGGGGVGATASATLAGTKSCVASWTVSGSCSSRKGTTVTGVGLSGGSGSGFSGSITFHNGTGAVSSTSIQLAGSGYTSNPTTLTNLTGCGSLTLTANAGYLIQSLSLTAGGGGYATTPAVSVAVGTGTTGTPASGTATLGAQPAGAGQVTAINVTAGGSGYSSPPAVVLTGGGFTSAAAATSDLGTTWLVSDISIDNPGSGYISDPAVTFSGGGISGVSATASIGRGPNYGSVYMLTSLAQTRTGARAMSQMEVATPVLGYSALGALTLDGPSPAISSMPNSNNFVVNGNDANSCGQTAEPDHPAIGAYDDPNAEPPTNSVETIVDSLPRPDHYTGLGGYPSVQNVYGGLGETMGTPTGLKALIDAIHAAPGAHVYGNSPGSIVMGTSSSPTIDYVDGDLTLSGNPSGYGILVVTGNLQMSGNFTWHGIVLVVGNGVADWNGGGNGVITGTVLVAKIWDNYTNKNLLSDLGSPTISWSGGGGNGILYDHCWAENLMSSVPFTPPPTTKPLKVLSTRSIPY